MNYIIFLLFSLSAFISAQLIVYIFFTSKKIYIKGLLGAMSSIFIYSLFYSLELISPNLKLMKICAGMQYIGILSIPIFWLIMAMDYTKDKTNNKKLNNKYFYIGAFTLIGIFVFLNFTNDYHHLFYKNYSMEKSYGLSIALIEPGIIYLLTNVYINILSVIGMALYMKFYLKCDLMYKKRSFIFMLTALIPWIGYFIYHLKILPIKLDIIPIFMEITCLIYTYALVHSSVFETVAIARHIVFDNLNDIVIVLDTYNYIVDANKKAEIFLNKKINNLIGKNIKEALSNFIDVSNYIESEINKCFQIEVQFQNKQSFFRGEITCIDHKGKLIALTDITEQISMIKNLQYYATKDTLTGAYNRNYLYEVASKSIQLCQENNQPVAFVMMDLDKFKYINDTYGHIAGDAVLRKVIEVCKRTLEINQCIIRYGGEEFVIILENVEDKEAFEIIEKVRMKIMATDIIYGDKTLNVTCSFGIFSGKGIIDLESMINFSDEAMYEAKNSGRNKVVIKKVAEKIIS